MIHSKYDVSDQSACSMHSERKDPAGIDYHWDKGQAAYNLYGLQLWKYNIEVHVDGAKDGNEKSIIGYSTNAKIRSGPFYKCVANVGSKSFKRGEEGHLDFEWSYEYESAWGKNSGAGGEKLVIPEELD